jgi:type VI secretion system protein ImpG
MDTRLLHYYERELRYLRELGAEFAQQFPKVAARLGLAELACADPHVERLLEGFAFMAARVHLKLDAEYPRFTQHMMELVYPHYLAPTPSMTVVQFVPSAREGSLAGGFTLPRGSVLRARTPLRDAAPCEYRTAHPVELWPFEIEQVEYTSVLRDLADLRLPSREPVKALLRIRLKATAGRPFSAMPLQALPLFVRGADELSARLYEQLVTNVSALVLRWGPDTSTQVALSSAARPVRPIGFGAEHALLPVSSRSFDGYRLLQEYFAFPSRFDFVELTGLAEGVSRCTSEQLELLLPLTRFDPSLEGTITRSRLVAFATPAINLFPRRCDRLPLPARNHDLHVLPDRTRPLDFEVHTIQRVAAYLGAEQERELPALYAQRGRLEHAQTRLVGNAYGYAIERRPRVASQARLGTSARTPRTPYAGSEVFLTLAGPSPNGGDSQRAGPQQLGVEAMCTNRDLPLLLSLGRGDDDFSVQSGAPVAAVRCIAGPTPPRSAPLDGDTAWRLLSHLSLNYLSLCQETGGGEAVREMLALYAQLGDPLLRRQVEGVRDVSAASVLRPLPGPGPRCFARGLEVSLHCEEQAFSGHGVFTLAAVMSAFFAKHAAINSFSETVLLTRERGEVFRWPTTAGLRHTL